MPADADVIIVGGGAAGLATAVFAGRSHPGLRVLVLDGARAPGAKILVSGGSRCNVTNRSVTERDFNGGRPSIVRRVLRAFPAERALDWFAQIGVPLHEEADGKLFPDSNSSRDVLRALLDAVSAAGARLLAGHRVLDVRARCDGFEVETDRGPLTARAVVLATGGLALPKTGSDGAGYAFARALGHGHVPTTPALVPLVLEGDQAYWSALSGVATPARLTAAAGADIRHASGSLLWTHFGISGPAALDISRHWLRLRLTGVVPALRASFVPDGRFEDLERRWLDRSRRSPRGTIQHVVSATVPSSMAAALLREAGVDGSIALADCARADRRAVLHALLGWPLRVRDSRGYTYAEVTAGGVPLDEIDPGTMESRRCRRLFLVGEILDVDGRLGGFNFQWAWSSGYVAGRAVGAALRAAD